MLGNVCIALIRGPVCDVINFEISYNFLIKPFFCTTKKSGQKFKYLDKIIVLAWNKKHFDHFKGFLLKQIKITFLEEGNPILSLEESWYVNQSSSFSDTSCPEKNRLLFTSIKSMFDLWHCKYFANKIS